MNFKKIFAALVLTAASHGIALAQSTTYLVNSSGSYSSFLNFSSCPAGQPCANFTTSMTQGGSFTVSSPLGTSLNNAIITPTAYSFSDGINTYSNTDAGSRIHHFKVTTNGLGNITSTDIFLSRWLSGANGTINDRVSFFVSSDGSSYNNDKCLIVSTSGGLNTCTGSVGNNTQTGFSRASGATVTWSPPSYTVGGAVSGLGTGQSVVLKNNAGDDLTVNANGAFTFSTAIISASAYAVTVGTQPTNQTCTVTNGAGTASGNVTNVMVACVSAPAAEAIPTLSEWAMIFMASLMAMFGYTRLRSRRT